MDFFIASNLKTVAILPSSDVQFTGKTLWFTKGEIDPNLPR
jgi:hypothetical protein